MKDSPWHIWIDTGGTFTDCIAVDPDDNRQHVKVLSNSSLRGTVLSRISPDEIHVDQHWNAPDDFIKELKFTTLGGENIMRTVTAFNAEKSIIRFDSSLPPDADLSNIAFEIRSDEEAPILACRLATGTLPGQSLPPVRMRLATTKGTNALLEENGAPTLLLITGGFRDFIEIGDQKRPDLFAAQVRKPKQLYNSVIEIAERMNADGTVLKNLNLDSCKHEIQRFLKRDQASVAVCLMHSYKNDIHERKLKKWLQKEGAEYISCSSEMSPFIKLLPRAQTTIVNAYLEPVLKNYLGSVKEALNRGKLYVMSSSAGLTTATHFNPKDSLLSGPAGGVVGATAVGKQLGYDSVISFDMGGTSTDVARYDDGFDYQFEHSVGEATIKAPALSIETVAAGGGSVCSFDGQKLTVGPESAGANPGPACYGTGGPLTLTDVNLLLGRLQPDNFSIPISRPASEQRLAVLLEELKKVYDEPPSKMEVLNGFIQIANERMADAINKISLRKGYNPSDYSLISFGGAGAQHAVAIANLLDINTVLVPKQAGLLSAYGLGQASIEQFAERQLLESLDSLADQLPSIINKLKEEARQKLYNELDEDSNSAHISRVLIFMRITGQESTLEIEYGNESRLHEKFKKAYKTRYGHWIEGRQVEVESIRVIASSEQEQKKRSPQEPVSADPEPIRFADVQFESRKFSTPVYRRPELKRGQQITGPAVILDPYSTTVLEPGWIISVCANGTMALTLTDERDRDKTDSYSESINLELFTNRFTSIAEEMGEMMRRTALSVNIKERLDYSCALLNQEGELVVNAPHIPVHLGALGLCVRELKKQITMEPGDVIVTNHPGIGGSHLPDITVVTPIFTESNTFLGYAACRAHHAEIGGSRPGSMPPDAASLAEEGVVIPPIHLLKSGKPKWDQIKNILESSEYPSRSVEENLADLQAAVAANHRGAKSLRNLALQEGAGTVSKYMSALKGHASQKARKMLQKLPDKSVESKEYLDDGTLLKAVIAKTNDQLYIDFSGTDGIHPGNLNATPAIVQSVIMYVLRLLIDEPLPLNEGILEPVTITIPDCLLNPDFSSSPRDCPAVVGGNTETSQRLVDLILKPFETIACSQGTMNNVLFGNDSFGYYETIGGGTGAGPTFKGCDAVHHHMTNTAGTDPEVLEHRYPVKLDRYEIRNQSGGNGKYRGGNGITRELTFLAPISLSVLTQHRKEFPYGLHGGKPGKTGEQYIIRKNGSRESLKSIDGAELESGDRFIIHTPGGGGYGRE